MNDSEVDVKLTRPKIFYGWYIVAACVFIALYVSGVLLYGFTAVFEPIADEFGWSYTAISLASSLRGVESGLFAPVMGFLVDRWGPRRLLFGGSIIIFLGFLLLSNISSLLTYYIAFAVLALGQSTCAVTVFMTAVNKWFRRKAGLAVGIVSSGFGLGGLLIPILTGLIDTFSWRTAMMMAGVGVLVVILPLSLVIRDKPERYGYHPDGDASSVAGNGTGRPGLKDSVEVNLSTKQALRNRAFWHIIFAALCVFIAISAVVTHMMPFLSTLGISRSVASLIALLLPVFSIAGRLGGGWLGGKYGFGRIFKASLLLLAGGVLILGCINVSVVWLLIPFIIIYSLGWGSAITTRISLQREYFGISNFGAILGITTGIMTVGGMLGAPVAGWVFDTWGSYQGVWLAFGALLFVGTILIVTLPAPCRTDTCEESV